MNWWRARVAVMGVGLFACGVAVATAETTAHSSAAKPTRVDLATGMPSFARGYRLSLTRAVIPPGGAFPPHRHPGMQVSYIASGTLQFQVYRGAVKVYRGIANGSQQLVRIIRAGHSGLISRGEWIVENQRLWHRGVNAGHGPVVILLAALLRADKPPAIPVTP